ncbi:hypothetical protein GUITHDRAFT_140748 [Guillardia theta CCMP2712]|uniref:Uncharacterized protein n=1 Tax=Guillardia theta (strain CCMP2712) TaxID=905079 RepID=L1J4C6_GUITC|nr:hypothetical protein GUITHDRAFT_140748 [Guillardia theta CCMP2712]EKX43182.1 hypothetical protein GUITHDRAFT_140748 [Guillardia theta CCMP2712]|eukprot:XP_005830162.1 hypothetical protein GUITHDRAFT_140748 [Guillardia theta CCMP2712]
MQALACEGGGSRGSPTEGAEQIKPVTRLSFKGRPGEDGYARRVRIIEAMMAYSPATMFGIKGKGKAYKEVLEILNRDVVFHDSLKENTLREKWCEIMKVVDRIVVTGEESYLKTLESEGKQATKLDDLYILLAQMKAKWADSGGARDSDGDEDDIRVPYVTAAYYGDDKRKDVNGEEAAEPKTSEQDKVLQGETQPAVTREDAQHLRWESSPSNQRDEGGTGGSDKSLKLAKRIKVSRSVDGLLLRIETQRLQAEAAKTQAEAEKIKAEAAKAKAEVEKFHAQTARIVALKEQNDSIARVLQAFVNSVKEGVTLPAGVMDMLSSIKPGAAVLPMIMKPRLEQLEPAAACRQCRNGHRVPPCHDAAYAN